MGGHQGIAGQEAFFRLVPGSVGLAGLPDRGHWAVVPGGRHAPPVAAVTEELAYRALLQRQLEQCVPGKWGLFTGGMLMTSALFALSHLPTHTPLMAALTFFPSLAFGALWTRHRSLWLCAAVHFWYNLLFFL